MTHGRRALAFAGILGVLGALLLAAPASAVVPAATTATAGPVAGGTTAEAVGVPTLAAANGANFMPGYIIDDSKFFDANAMSVSEIQAFLNAKVPACASGYTCLRNYTETTRTIPASPMCGTYQGAANESAAMIIFKVQQACGVSAKTILVTLQKEQGLVTKTAPSAYAYRSAMGAGCPDTAPCDAEYYGFFNQVHYGSFLFKRYTQPAGTGPGTAYPTRFDLRYQVGSTTAVLWNPNAACGSAPVYISNQATHALYVYTPYQPNAAALANMYGTGDGCSSYGNRNFWAYYTDWFGPTTGADQPIGMIDAVSVNSAGITVRGWALDPNTPDPIEVEVSVDGGTPVVLRTDKPRADVAAAYPGTSVDHGFEITVPASDGVRSICVTGRNVGVGANALIGCRTAEVRLQNPWGRVDVAQATELGALVTGWVVDPNSTQPIWTHVYVDGVFWDGVYADGSRPDVAAGIPGAGTAHGFRAEIPLPAGRHEVCVFGINVGAGQNSEAFCRTIDVPTRTPRGYLDDVEGLLEGVQVRGWALDPGTTESTWLHIYVDGAFATGIQATTDRPDVGAAFPGRGAAHGFSTIIPAAAGTHSVCVYALNVQGDKSASLGCRSVRSGVAPPPRGSVDAITAGAGTVRVQGWTFDPNSTAPTWTHVYIDGRFVAGLPADQARGDVAAAYTNAGPTRGFDGSIAATRGTRSVCVYGLSASGSTSTLLGCRTVAVG